jgi:purine-cytosine permease-like protein
MTASTEAVVHSEADALSESVEHDYATSETGVVPLERRRPFLHFLFLMLTLEGGLSSIFVGFTLFDAGFTLPSSILILLGGCGAYLVFATFSAYLGARTGQTHSLLTRSVFGITGSVLITLILVIKDLGWAGFQANLTAQVWDGLFGWGHVLVLGMVIAVGMGINNWLGFSGVATFARRVGAPLLLLWTVWMLIKGVTGHSELLDAKPETTAGLSVAQAVTLVLGFAMWGNEADLYRYSKPRLSWSFASIAAALLVGLVMMASAGWLVAGLSTGRAFGDSVLATTEYSLFGLGWLAFVVITLTQVALNDGNYYAVVNGMQNLLGGWHRWKRAYAAAVAIAGAVLAAWVIPFVVTDGFFKLAAFGAFAVPCATIIMVVDHFLLPRLLRISRPLTDVPAWRGTAMINVPGFFALVVSILYGAWASELITIPGTEPWSPLGVPALSAWVLSGVLYLIGATITRAVAGDVPGAMGFAAHLRGRAPSDAVVDITTPEAGGAGDRRETGADALVGV